jgi:hypothetical protein
MSLSGVLMRKGAAVTLTGVTPGTYDPATDTTTGGSTVTLAGHAMQIDGDPDLYTQLGLIESENPTLLFKPASGSVPDVLGWTIVWGGETLTIKNVTRLAMAGVTTAAKLVVSR